MESEVPSVNKTLTRAKRQCCNSGTQSCCPQQNQCNCAALQIQVQRCDCANIQQNQCGCSSQTSSCNCPVLQQQYSQCGCGALTYEVR